MTALRHIAEPDAPPQADPDDRYLDAAREAILDVGWSRTTLTDIARRAGVSRMTLYRRWPDTRGLLGDLMTREWHGILRDALDRAPTLPTSPAAIADLVVAVVAGLRDDPLLRRVVELDPEVLLPYLLVRRGRGQDQLVEVLAELLRAAQATGEVRSGDPAAMAGTLLLAMQGPVLGAATVPAADRAAHDDELRLLVRGHLVP